MKLDETIAQLALSTVFSHAMLRERLEELREGARAARIGLTDDQYADLLRAVVTLETVSPPRFHLATRSWSGLAVPAVIAALSR